ncbi:NTE family protein [Deinobacterium chartae]|uniref:NTE family protein n=1 Tax=Deinobacterium chartae TaxID=521158 RepID=A0A841I0G2_9DEIO|nr:patatin-like phospholipase family protein [Deinobacterium chartae]MBB6099147.1 NTE family protein [Deinobacterium chartae]
MTDQPQPLQEGGRGFGLALGGGAARGFAHLGVMGVLEREGLQPDLISGTSMGGLLGAFFAAGHSAAEVQRLAAGPVWASLIDLLPGSGLLRFSGLEALLRSHLPPTFEELKRPLCVTATDLISGRQVYLHRGDLYKALTCTIAYPGAVDPTWYGDQLLADGGILNQLPVDAALFLGARRVLAVDVTAPAQLALRPNDHGPSGWIRLARRNRRLGMLQTARRSIEIMQSQLTDARLSLYAPDLVLRPDMSGIELGSFWRLNEAVTAGERVAEENLEALRRHFGPTSD